MSHSGIVVGEAEFYLWNTHFNIAVANKNGIICYQEIHHDQVAGVIFFNNFQLIFSKLFSLKNLFHEHCVYFELWPWRYLPFWNWQNIIYLSWHIDLLDGRVYN